MDVLKTVANQMTELVEDLLDLSRYERGVVQINRVPVILNELVRIAVQMQQPLADSQGLTLGMVLPDDEIIVSIDQARIGQVLTNLIANAINYTPPDGEIVVHLKRTPHAAQIDVLDTGIGIAHEVVSRIFEPFYRVSEQSGVGTGLGLSIAQEIMELHDGSLTVESLEDHGSTFTILLPFE